MSGSMRPNLEGHNLGIYKLERRLGRGGMGEVYLARDTQLDRPVAIKLLLAAHADNEMLVQRFQREARAVARLSHPNIVQIFSVGEEDGLPYLVMEYIQGVSLQEMMRGVERLPWSRVVSICGQVASALDCAHANGIVHRDIKPANILIDKQGRVRVTDFGIAKLAESQTQLTSDGMILGTPQYMSPEQCGSGAVTPSSDLFSLGVMAFEMLSGILPFRAETPAGLIRKIVMDPPPPLQDLVSDLPEEAYSIVGRLLAKDPAERYQSAVEVMLDLKRHHSAAQAGMQTPAPVTPVSAFARKSSAIQTSAHSRLILRIIIFALVVILVILAGVVSLRVNRKRQQPPPDETWTPSTENNQSPGAQPGFLFKKLDKNGDGRIMHDEAQGPVLERFDQIDANQDGSIDLGEFREHLKKLRRNQENSPVRPAR